MLFQLLTDLSKAFDSSYSAFAEILFGVPRGFFCFCFLEIGIEIAIFKLQKTKYFRWFDINNLIPNAEKS